MADIASLRYALAEGKAWPPSLRKQNEPEIADE